MVQQIKNARKMIDAVWQNDGLFCWTISFHVRIGNGILLGFTTWGTEIKLNAQWIASLEIENANDECIDRFDSSW